MKEKKVLRVLGAVNFFIIQWFFIRICICYENNVRSRWGILFPIIPLTGWWTDYIPSRRKGCKIK